MLYLQRPVLARQKYELDSTCDMTPLESINHKVCRLELPLCTYEWQKHTYDMKESSETTI